MGRDFIHLKKQSINCNALYKIINDLKCCGNCFNYKKNNTCILEEIKSTSFTYCTAWKSDNLTQFERKTYVED